MDRNGGCMYNSVSHSTYQKLSVKHLVSNTKFPLILPVANANACYIH